MVDIDGFHRAPPAISVKDYLFRLIIHATLSPPILLSMVFYVDKLCSMYPAFTISSLTVHRFLITAATVAAKGLSDSVWTNRAAPPRVALTILRDVFGSVLVSVACMGCNRLLWTFAVPLRDCASLGKAG